MKTLILAAIRCSLIFTAVAALSVAYPASVQAVPTTYQYTGNPFTFVTGPPYTTSDFVTAMVTLAGPLAPNMPLTSVSPIAFTFSDGVQTLTNSNFFMQFATGPTGAIIAWNVVVEGLNDLGSLGQIGTRNTVVLLVQDFGFLEALTIRGLNHDNPGTWTTVGNVSDTGSTLSLMTLTLMALGLVARQFKRRAA